MRSVRRWVGACALATALSVPANAWAQTAPLDDAPVTPRMMALGGRAEAAGSSTSALFANPAMMTSAQSNHGDALALYDPTVNRYQFGSAMMDSTRSSVAAGLTYVYDSVDNPTESRH